MRFFTLEIVMGNHITSEAKFSRNPRNAGKLRFERKMLHGKMLFQNKGIVFIFGHFGECYNVNMGRQMFR